MQNAYRNSGHQGPAILKFLNANSINYPPPIIYRFPSNIIPCISMKSAKAQRYRIVFTFTKINARPNNNIAHVGNHTIN